MAQLRGGLLARSPVDRARSSPSRSSHAFSIQRLANRGIGIRDYRALTDEDNIYLFFELMNYGDTATGPFDVRVTEGDDASLSEPFTLHMVSMPGLGPYGEVTGQLMFNPSCRSCSLQVEVDPDGLLDDTDRSDNVSAQFYTRLKDPT